MPNSPRLRDDASEHSQRRLSESLEIEDSGFFQQGNSWGNRSGGSTTAISPNQNVPHRIPRSHSVTRSFGSSAFPRRSLTTRSSTSLPIHSRMLIDEWRAAASESKEETGVESKTGSKMRSKTGRTKAQSKTGRKTGSKAGTKGGSKTWNKSGNSIKQKQRTSADPPRPAREGCEWVWYPEGYWAEREIVAVPQSSELPWKSKSRFMWKKVSRERGDPGSIDAVETTDSLLTQDQPSPNNSQVNCAETTHRMQYSPKESEPSKTISMSSEQSNRLVRGLQQMSPMYPHFVSPSGEPEGLYCKTKRGLGVGQLEKRTKAFDQDSIFNVLHSPSQTTMTLEGAATYFKQLEVESSFSDQPYNRTASIRSIFSPKRIGLAPWHRSNSQDDSWSVTSSIRDLVKGRTPAGTPNSEMMYNGPDGQNYFKVEISNPTDPVFLPSEARRVNTPPINETSAAGKARGFFFDLKPLDDELLPETLPSHKSSVSRASRRRDTPSTSTREWWDDNGLATVRRKEKRTTEFALDVPEHLPSSPLCPLNPMHKSGGNGVCVYHGRRKSDQVTP